MFIECCEDIVHVPNCNRDYLPRDEKSKSLDLILVKQSISICMKQGFSEYTENIQVNKFIL